MRTKKKMKTTMKTSREHYGKQHPAMQAVKCNFCNAAQGEMCHGSETHSIRVRDWMAKGVHATTEAVQEDVSRVIAAGQ